MALRKLPFEVQSKFRASTKTRSFKTAVEELVYNALDADSSSIAIRVHIKENYIQVVDNGRGIAKDDFKILGQRYATSKYEQSTTSESFEMYGCCGQSLANLIDVSQSVKIVSKSINNVETWMKHFCNGKEEACSAIAERPSVGTTVEIKGFLYNLTIQKKSLKALSELQNIKTFLEQVSLIHCNTSISLRDNAENEIVFKIHKNRDIMQTLSSVLSICNLREFQVEKNQYKVTGLIQNNNEQAKGYQWIYVNGRFIENSNLHKIVSENLAKCATVRSNVKSKNYIKEEERVPTHNKLPDYFIFVKCPKSEYDIISNHKQSILEFKNVAHINKLLNKLVKFYMGDTQITNVTTTNQPVGTPANMAVHKTDTRNKVKQIMQKILGTQQKKLNCSNLRNGVKGKIMRRRDKKQGLSKKSKLNLRDDNINQDEICAIKNLRNVKKQIPGSKNVNNNASPSHVQVPPTQAMPKKIFANGHRQQKQHTEKRRSATKKNPEKKYGNNINKQPVLSKFEKETDDVHERCNILAKRVNHLLGVKKKRKCKIFTNETIQYNNIFTNNKNISVRKKIKEIIIQEYVPKSQKVNKNYKNLKNIKKSNDLLRPVKNILSQNGFFQHISPAKMNWPQPLHVTDGLEMNIPGPTYESHAYTKHSKISRSQVNFVEKYNKSQFTSKDSYDNFASPIEDRDLPNTQNVYERLHDDKINDRIFTGAITSSYSIHFTKTKSQIEKRNNQAKESDVIISNNKDIFVGSTYTIAESEELEYRNFNEVSSQTCITDTFDNHDVNLNMADTVNFHGKQSAYAQKPDQSEIANVTAEKPDVNVVFISNSQFSNSGSNRIDPLKMCEAVIDSHDSQDSGDTIENTFIFDFINNATESNISYGAQKEELLEPIVSHIFRKVEDSEFFNNYLCNNREDCELGGNAFGFYLKNRRRYIPKGMSPIFDNCNLKNICDYELAEDYYEETIYNNFAQNIQINSEIFEPKIQNVKETTARDVQRVDIKLNKDSASLTFNARCLKQAKVIGQVDTKFIATIMNGDSSGAHDCLVLFDQHAVHERIRLEQKMSEYLSHEQWKSIPVDEFSLKLNRDEILYLHNYREKFEKFGLQWHTNVANDTQVMVNGIPEAILGKHQRQVHVVLKAVKSLIKEEISIIKEQGGCVSLYPKSIMDLVFSEACRYAIMFGTPLSARECSELMASLSKCRTPFQCAHGRPALAVLVDVMRETRPYTVNFTKVEEFRRKQTKINK